MSPADLHGVAQPFKIEFLFEITGYKLWQFILFKVLSLLFGCQITCSLSIYQIEVGVGCLGTSE